MYQVVIPGCGRGACTAMSILFFFFFLIGGFSSCPVSGLS